MSTRTENVIGLSHPQDGRQWECQCARCGSSLEWEHCGACGGDGITGPGELYEEDPLYHGPDDFEACSQCGGEAHWPLCLSSAEWCQANPLPGRENIERSKPEWFVVGDLPDEEEQAY